MTHCIDFCNSPISIMDFQ